MKNHKECSLKELKDVWEKFGWLMFSKFEDYVAEVRKVEADIQKGKITLKTLKNANDKKIHSLQAKLASNNETLSKQKHLQQT